MFVCLLQLSLKNYWIFFYVFFSIYVFVVDLKVSKFWDKLD